MANTNAYDFVVGTLRDFTSCEAISGSDHLVCDLALDSIDVMDALAQVEDEYGLVIPTDILPRLRTVNDLVQEVERRMTRAPKHAGASA